jgi:hypothetical protein
MLHSRIFIVCVGLIPLANLYIICMLNSWLVYQVSCDEVNSGCCNGLQLLSTGDIATHFPDLLDTYRQVRRDPAGQS